MVVKKKTDNAPQGNSTVSGEIRAKFPELAKSLEDMAALTNRFREFNIQKAKRLNNPSRFLDELK